MNPYLRSTTMNETPTYPYLKELTSDDLIQLLAEYVKKPALIEVDAGFIKAIQKELKMRKF